jgi:hypothetical protein
MHSSVVFPLCTPVLSVVQALDFRVFWKPGSGKLQDFKNGACRKKAFEPETLKL